MPADFWVQTKGVREFRRDLRKLDRQADRELRANLRRAGEEARQTAAATAPHLTGELAASLRLYVSGPRVTIASRLPQAPVLHWGGTIEPRGVPITFERTEFITRAVELHADDVVESIADSIVLAARRVGWRR